MSKAKMYGMPTKCVPNSKADARRPRKLPQKIVPKAEPPMKKKPKKAGTPCWFNEGVSCTAYNQHGNVKSTGTNCATCGWNPAVTMARNAKLGISTPPREESQKMAETP